MTEQEIRQKLSDRNLTVVAKRIGHKYSSVRNFVSGDAKRPTWELVKALEEYLEAWQ